MPKIFMGLRIYSLGMSEEIRLLRKVMRYDFTGYLNKCSIFSGYLHSLMI